MPDRQRQHARRLALRARSNDLAHRRALQVHHHDPVGPVDVNMGREMVVRMDDKAQPAETQDLGMGSGKHAFRPSHLMG